MGIAAEEKFSAKITHPDIYLDALDNLWFQVSGTLCNIACEHCFISCGPTNRNFEFMTLEQVERYLKESVEMGVKEYYFTGGEPFMNKQILEILELTLQYGPVTVLTNGMLIREKTARRLQIIEANSIYSLEIRVSIDGYTKEMNDAIRGKGVFKKAMRGVQLLYEHGFLPIITITKTWEDSRDEAVMKRFIQTLKVHGYLRPRLKILPSLKIGREIVRDRGYNQYETVTSEMLNGYDCRQLICSNSRVATSWGIFVCPILIESSDAYMGKTLKEAAKSYQLKDQACYTCYLYGAICSNFSSGGKEV